MRYAIVIEKIESNYSAYVPDLPGCVATGATVEEVENAIREAIEFHLSGLREDGVAIPLPSSHVEYIEVAPDRALRFLIQADHSKFIPEVYLCHSAPATPA